MDEPVKPVVTVVIAAWNAADTIGRAIDSALAQTIPVEVVVIDDASTDDTSDRAEAAAGGDPRVRVLRQARNQGPSAARNRAIDVSTAPWIAVLDADDFMEPGRLAALESVARETGADFVADDLLKVAEDDLDGPRSRMFSDEALGQMPVSAAMFIEANLSSRHGGRREMGFLKPLMSRNFLRRHALRYDTGIRLGEDYVLYAEALVAGAKFILTDPQGYVAVVRPGSLSGRHPTEAHAALVAADRKLLTRQGVDRRTRRALRLHCLEQQRKLAWRRLIDAKRATDPVAALRCFFAPPSVSFDLMRRLGDDMLRRLGARLVRKPHVP